PATGIDENEELVISVFSYNNVVTIVNETLVPIKQVDIMDMHGRVIWKGQANGDRTEITLNVATGIYNVRVVTENNQHKTTKVNIN
ncbi:MAG: T9SS type A sorting domain-containing protein, partial [Bacteroidetes bacterium]|nr:T9SS type A sorting domain-containing protein [Bacteroidota bacterium]MCL2303699.1 T9SS type A sorting domain-containing protein [Lentimicrobiaceae bacterium]